MTNPTESAEDRFVEAMQAVIAHLDPKYEHHPLVLEMVNGAIEAVADMVCEAFIRGARNSPAAWCDDENHKTCRARLLARVKEGR
jgi:hypothetical protein